MMRKFNLIKLIGCLFVITFCFLIYKIIFTDNGNEYVSSMPVTSESETCMSKELAKVTWPEGQTYNFIKFSDKLISRPNFIGYLNVRSSNERTHVRVRPLFNMLMSKCFSETVYEFKFSYPFEQKLLDDLNFVVKNESKDSFNILNIELDFKTKNLKIFSSD